ncbi:MAG: putative rane protein [Pedosphaera sp.]|nr:putative rane protein [Pedosphaera sp.]
MKTEKKPSVSAPTNPDGAARRKSPLIVMGFFLALLLALFFWRIFNPAQVIFSNDGPYGATMAEHTRMPSTLLGVWANLNWLGGEGLSPPPSVSSLLRVLMSPLIYSKTYCPVALFIVGMGACFCFRQLRLAPVACILGGLAAALKSDFFSTSCWGVATQVMGFGFMFMAIGLIANPAVKRQWIRVVLAGLAVGVGVMEAYDIGALFSLFVAAFVVYHALFLDDAERHVVTKASRGILRTALVAGFAAFIAAHTLTSLVGTQIKGVSGMQQDEATRAARWAEATYFSIPKAETLQVLVPGIFGFRDNWYMYEYDAPKEDQYWGSIGAMPGLQHLVGTGFYAGVPVVLIALWAVFQSFRGGMSPFKLLQRRSIWFWAGTAVISLLFAYGKNAPFYQLFYAIPYASTIRNPQKFMHVFSWALIILFAYGVHGLAGQYLQNYVARVGGILAQFKNWHAKAGAFERKWLYVCLGAIGASLLAWMLYFSNRHALESYLQTVGIPAPGTPLTPGVTSDSGAVSLFSLHAVGWYVLILTLTVGLLALIFSGQFSGSRARWGGVLLGALMIFDLGRADVPWIVYWDLDYKYAADPVIQFLADKPYEHRISSLLAFGVPISTQQLAIMANMYGNDWKQHLFPEKNIQCADIVQEPRVTVDKEMYMNAIGRNALRFWELSNTRYLLGPADFVQQLAKQQPGAEKLFRVVNTFDFVPKRENLNEFQSQFPANYKTELNPNGQLAVIEFLGALPRAKLFSNWQVSTNDQSTLQTLASQSFDPHQTVLVSNNIPAAATTNADQSAGTVEINPNYKSKRIELQADAKVPSVLLFSEKYSPRWQVEVDGKPAPLVRCNLIERGVYLTPGKHDIVMRYVAPIQTLCISLSAAVLGLLLWGFLAFAPVPEGPVLAATVSQTKEKSAAKQTNTG